jgi:hypothetical protein
MQKLHLINENHLTGLHLLKFIKLKLTGLF